MSVQLTIPYEFATMTAEQYAQKIRDAGYGVRLNEGVFEIKCIDTWVAEVLADLISDYPKIACTIDGLWVRFRNA